MKIQFENFGAIKRGEMEIAPLTLLCGANNTSKTYALYALYGLLEKRAFWNFSEWESIGFNPEGVTVIDLEKFLRQHWTKLQKDIGDQFTASLPQFFATDKKSFENTKIRFEGGLEATLEAAKRARLLHSVGFAKGPFRVNFRKSANKFTLTVSGANKPLTVEQKKDANEGFSSSLSHIILGFIFRVAYTAIRYDDYFILPAERAGVNVFYSELSILRTAMMHPSSELNLFRGFKTSRYPKPVADYIDFLNFSAWGSHEESDFADIALELQTQISDGAYEVNAERVITFRPNNVEHSLDLHLSSSTAKSYFGLWFYLKHTANTGDVLMIDEPELNLHPDNQRRLARLFARMVNRGIRVVLSTHSDYIVRELNNLIVLSNEFPERGELREKYGYSEDDSISPEKVRAYCFGGGTIQPMEISPDEGILAETFDEVINELNNSSYELASAWAEHREQMENAK